MNEQYLEQERKYRKAKAKYETNQMMISTATKLLGNIFISGFSQQMALVMNSKISSEDLLRLIKDVGDNQVEAIDKLTDGFLKI